MIIKRIILVAIFLCLAVTLLNSNAFGGSSLIAFFFYATLASVGAVFILSALLLKKQLVTHLPPPYTRTFLLLCAYILIHGAATHTTGLTHYYWAANGIFLLALSTWAQPEVNRDKLKWSLYRGVIFLALVESAIVLLQCIGIINVPGNLYLCTGTWMNPNVTAMFLALSLFALIQIRKMMTGPQQKFLIAPILFIIVLAILLLQCRTAYIVTAILLLTAFWEPVKKLVKRNLKLNIRGLVLGIVVIAVCQILFGVFAYKQASTRSRIQIWRHSLQLMAEKPLFGHGFGMFEKEYNLYAAQQENPTNDHVSMPYNDLVELGIEGGLVAVACWVIFLLQLWKRFNRSPSQLALLISFISIQVTNFGFQAIPATVLFLFFISLEAGSLSTENKKTQEVIKPGNPAYRRIIFGIGGITACVLLFFAVTGLMGAFYKKWLLMKQPLNQNSLVQLQALEPQLAAYASFHENYGDLYMSQRRGQLALPHYLKALERSSNPDLLIKSALCYQVLNNYDSSEYYFTTLQNMQPHRFIPRFSLLKLYEQHKDSTMVLVKAREILKMPVKVRSKRVNEIKKYARTLVDTYGLVQPGLSNFKN